MKIYTSDPRQQDLETRGPRCGTASRLASWAVTTLLLALLLPANVSAFTTTVYKLNVLNLAPDDVFFDDQCYYDFNNGIWGDINSEFNNDLSGNDPDFLETGEYVLADFKFEDSSNTYSFGHYGFWADSNNFPLGTFGPYRYGLNLEDGLTSRAFGQIQNWFTEDYRFKLTYGCRNGQSNWSNVNDRAHVKTSPVFDVDSKPFSGDDTYAAHAVAFAVIVDCDGTIGWGETFYEAYNDAMGIEESDWTSWSSRNSQSSEGDDREPLHNDGSGWTSHGISPGRVKDIQCRQGVATNILREEWQNRTGVSTPRVHTCSVDSGFSCQASEQVELFDDDASSWDPGRYWTPESCGNWEIRTLLYDQQLVNLNSNNIAGGALKDGSVVLLHLSGEESGTVAYQVKSDQTDKWIWTARFSDAINESEFDVKAGEWQSSGLQVIQSQYRNSVWGYTSNTTASVEVVEPRLIGNISGVSLLQGDVVRLRVRYGNFTVQTFTHTIPSDYLGKSWRWPPALARVINAQEDSTPFRAGEYNGTTLTYPGSNYRNRVWVPDDDPAWNIVIDYNP